MQKIDALQVVAVQREFFEKVIVKFDRDWFLAIMRLYVAEVDFRTMIGNGCVNVSDSTKKFIIYINVNQWRYPYFEDELGELEKEDEIEREQKLTLVHEVIHIYAGLHGVGNGAVSDDLIEKAAVKFYEENEELIAQVFSAVRNGRSQAGKFNNQVFSEFFLKAP